MLQPDLYGVMKFELLGDSSSSVEELAIDPSNFRCSFPILPKYTTVRIKRQLGSESDHGRPREHDRDSQSFGQFDAAMLGQTLILLQNVTRSKYFGCLPDFVQGALHGCY